MRHVNRHRGAALIVVLGVLAVLVLLATTFATVQGLEQRVATNYLDGVRAKLIARAGVDVAVGHIQTSLARGMLSDPAMRYWGENLSETGVADEATPLERAKNPSFAWEDEPDQNPANGMVRPMLFTVDGETIGLSGFMETSSKYGPNTEVYRLRVSDANGRIHVNDGVENGKDGNVSRNLRRLLNALGKIPTVGVAGAGDRILEGRPTGGYRSRRQLEDVLGASDYRRVAPFVTTSAWVDTQVVNPVPISEMVAKRLDVYPVHYNKELGRYRYGRSFDAYGNPIPGQMEMRFAPELAEPTGTDHAVMALDELNAQWIERTARAPVNVNEAPREVLIALVTGLRGFFLLERRRTNPGVGLYAFLDHDKYDNGPGGKRGDEYGYLYSTAPFLGPGESGTGVSAEKVADEIVACRNRSVSPNVPSLDYSRVWYGGPFRSWRQFHAFCDGLVGTVLRDDRPIFYDFLATNVPGPSSGPNTLVPSPIQVRYAAQAMADVLKANFNPNVALNELNPDANLHLIVDKTDLICNSTEFCFTPMGVYEIESEGLVLHTPNEEDFLTVRQAEVVARRMVHCAVKLFDVRRETSQADFIEGRFSSRRAGTPATNNNKPLEIGPEPYNGRAASECRWSGWIQLGTIGGHWTSIADEPEKDSLELTPEGSGDRRGSVMHAHFSLDHRLHHSMEDVRDPLPFTLDHRNNRDRSEVIYGPYGPAGGYSAPRQPPNLPQDPYRLARDWHMTKKPAPANYRAASDLRIDGAYVERDSAIMYLNGLAVFDVRGTYAAWVKPSFRPEMTGKPRKLLSMDTINDLYGRRKQAINGLWLFASHDAPAFAVSTNERARVRYGNGPWRPLSLACGFSTRGSYSGGIGMNTSSLNHRGHDPADQNEPDVLKSHGWMHVVYYWDMTPPWTRDYKPVHTWMLINGQPAPDPEYVNVHAGGGVQATDFGNAWNPIRLGEPSKTTEYPWYGQLVSRNWSLDATLDEFYLWKGDARAEGLTLYNFGRYYKASQYAWGEAEFTSGRQAFPTASRDLPAVPAPPGPVGGATDRRIVAVAWTWYPEKVSPDGKPQVVNAATGRDVTAIVELHLVKNDAVVARLTDDRIEGVPSLVVKETDDFRYRLRVGIGDAPLGGGLILLTTPVIDDVTIYYSCAIEYLQYEIRETAL